MRAGEDRDGVELHGAGEAEDVGDGVGAIGCEGEALGGDGDAAGFVGGDGDGCGSWLAGADGPEDLGGPDGGGVIEADEVLLELCFGDAAGGDDGVVKLLEVRAHEPRPAEPPRNIVA